MNSIAEASTASSARTEQFVKAFLEHWRWTPLYHDIELCGVQIDLLCRDPFGLLSVVEVKAQGRGGMGRIAARQTARLLRTCQFLAQWEPVGLHLAFVEGGKVRLLPVDALTAR